MSEQTPAATEQQQTADSSQVEPGTQDTQEATSAQENWEQRFKDTQAWATRLAQEKVELEAAAQQWQALQSDDPTEYLKALKAAGFNVPEETEEDTQASEPDPRLRAELDELKQWKESLTAEQEREVNEQQYRTLVDPQLKDMKVPEGLWDVVAEAALNLPALQTPQGPQPDLAAAMQQVEAMAEHFAALPSVQSAVKKSWANTKPRTALTGPGGTAGTQVPDLDNRQERWDWMAQQLLANEQ
jgi:hypothetical protein